MIFDIATFISLKIFLVAFLAIAFFLIPLIVWGIVNPRIFGAVETKIGRVAVILCATPFYIMYLGWIWPFGLPPVDAHQHMAGAAWQSLVTPYEVAIAQQKKTPPIRTEKGVELRRYRLDGWNPPKHFYVDLTDLSTGAKHDQLYVSKHCNNHGSLKRGDEYNITLQKYEMSDQPGVIKYEFSNLYATFC